MKHHKMKSFVAGSLIGIVTGRLFMPPADSKTRRKILNKGLDMADDISRKVSDLKRK